MAKLRDHPKFFLAVAVLLTLVSFGVIFEFFTGLFGIVLGTTNSAFLPIEKAEALGPPGGLPPITILPAGDPFKNATYFVSSSGLKLCWEYWYFWPPSTAHPTNDWEPVYVYWDLGGIVPRGSGPQLTAIGVRIHFVWRLIFPPIALNLTQLPGPPITTVGIQPYVTFSATFHTPTVKTTLIGRLLSPGNSTVLYNYPLTQDPTSPPASGPFAYEQTAVASAGPIDPWILLNGLASYQGGIIWGGIGGGSIGLGSYWLFQVTIHPKAPKHRVRIRKAVLPFLEE
jgi:hypothetical protein